MAKDAISYLENKFKKPEVVIVTECGPVDAFGYARCMLSDKRTRVICNPVVGMVASFKWHMPEVIPLADQHGWAVYPRDGEPFHVLANELSRNP